MTVFLWLLVLINLALISAGFVFLQRLRKRLASLDAQAIALAKDVVPATESLMAELKKQAPTVISIEILNPLELAAQQSALAGTLGSVSPKIVRKIVYNRAADIIRVKLAEEGVDADLRIVRAEKVA